MCFNSINALQHRKNNLIQLIWIKEPIVVCYFISHWSLNHIYELHPYHSWTIIRVLWLVWIYFSLLYFHLPKLVILSFYYVYVTTKSSVSPIYECIAPEIWCCNIFFSLFRCILFSKLWIKSGSQPILNYLNPLPIHACFVSPGPYTTYLHPGGSKLIFLLNDINNSELVN